jgi:hypothetical protein
MSGFKLDRSAFQMGSNIQAEIHSRGIELSNEDRLRWSRTMSYRVYGLDPNQSHKLDRSAFSTKKFN